MRKIARHILLWLVALSILNTSIDVVEYAVPPLTTFKLKATRQPSDQIESIVELVMDQASNHEQRLPDTKNSAQQSLLKKSIVFDFSLPVKKEKLLSPFISGNNKSPSTSNDGSLQAGFITVFSPPPDRFSI